MTAYTELMAFERKTQALEQVAGRLGWDRETVMPRGAAPQRAEEQGVLAEMLHARRTDPQIGAWLELARDDGDPVRAANLRHIRRSFTRTARIPADLAAEIARVTSLAQGIWAEARAAEDFAGFAPELEKIVALTRLQADALAEPGESRYDALVQEYEPGGSEAFVTGLFDAMRPRLVALREKIAGSGKDPAPLTGQFDEASQHALARELALAFGYDLGHGRIDKAVHPFSSGSGLDVRITMRTDPADPFNCIYSTIHETGHAGYELGIDRSHLLTPLGAGVSLGVHESQSRIYENQIGRSRAFAGHLFGRMTDLFGPLSTADADAFYAAINRARPGFIRTEADEVHYNLHVMLRCDLERALISGDLAVADLPGAWNDRFANDFGMTVDKPSNGVLQDVHWAGGAIGYFPTYTLGNVYAGCLMQALRRDLPDLDSALAAGDTAPATGWLRENLQRHGGLYEPPETISRACRFAPTVGPLLDYLEDKFGALYGL